MSYSAKTLILHGEQLSYETLWKERKMLACWFKRIWTDGPIQSPFMTRESRAAASGRIGPQQSLPVRTRTYRLCRQSEETLAWERDSRMRKRLSRQRKGPTVHTHGVHIQTNMYVHTTPIFQLPYTFNLPRYMTYTVMLRRKSPPPKKKNPTLTRLSTRGSLYQQV